MMDRPSKPLTPRAQAIADGERKYHGRPCKNCGNTLRHVAGGCVQCTAAYHARLRQDPERRAKANEAAKRYRERDPERTSAASQRWNERYPERVIAAAKLGSEPTRPN